VSIVCVYEHLGGLSSVPAKTWRRQTFVSFDHVDVLLCQCVITCHGYHHDNAFIMHMLGKEKKRLCNDTLPNFLSPSDEAVEV
jgi:hypothetical protein